ncbi:MAG: hypothetical protein Q4D38_01485 [Planctomycetia bacterium]|nr:hypothetical protein [Planctomycetia bacterium]
MKRIWTPVLDIVMIFTLPLLMAYSLVGEATHEWLGLFMLALFVAHHARNRHWFRTFARGRYSVVRALKNATLLLLLATVIVLLASGVFMSKHAVPFLSFPEVAYHARTAHLLASYWGFVFMCAHLGIHFPRLPQLDGVFRMRFLTRKSTKVFLAIFVSIIAIYGAWAFVARRLPTYLFMQSPFVFFDYDEPILCFLGDYLAIMIMLACVSRSVVWVAALLRNSK